MFSLPRGAGVSVDVPLASAAWETPQAVERLAYRGKASLFVGAIAHSRLFCGTLIVGCVVWADCGSV
ncbi:hypothetical protein CCP3SC15_1260013 [Gammaproteobacteria bacterium]